MSAMGFPGTNRPARLLQFAIPPCGLNVSDINTVASGGTIVRRTDIRPVPITTPAPARSAQATVDEAIAHDPLEDPARRPAPAGVRRCERRRAPLRPGPEQRGGPHPADGLEQLEHVRLQHQ